MSTDHALPRAVTRERTKRKPEGRPPTNTWWKLALVAVAGMAVFAAALVDKQPMIAAIIGLVACWEGQKAWRAWPWYRDGHRPSAMPDKVLKLLADCFFFLAIGLVVVNAAAFATGHHAVNAAWVAYFISLILVTAEDRKLYRPGGWLRGRRYDPDEDSEP